MKEQFNLENFLAGKYERVETRINENVTELKRFSGNVFKPLVGFVEKDPVMLTSWNIDGRYNFGSDESENDLFGILKQQS